MNNQKDRIEAAIRHIQTSVDIDPWAMCLAVEALKAQLSREDATKDATNDDIISRQAAMDAFGLSEKTRKYGGDHSGYDTRMLYEIQNVLEGLPSAQPEIVRCKDCKHRYVEDMIWHCPFGLMGGENFFCGYGSLGTVERRRDG